jgi:hypothetical protein
VEARTQGYTIYSALLIFTQDNQYTGKNTDANGTDTWGAEKVEMEAKIEMLKKVQVALLVQKYLLASTKVQTLTQLCCRRKISRWRRRSRC